MFSSSFSSTLTSVNVLVILNVKCSCTLSYCNGVTVSPGSFPQCYSHRSRTASMDLFVLLFYYGLSFGLYTFCTTVCFITFLINAFYSVRYRMSLQPVYLVMSIFYVILSPCITLYSVSICSA